MNALFLKAARYGVVYATTGFVGLGVMAWMAYRARRIQAEMPEPKTVDLAYTIPAISR